MHLPAAQGAIAPGQEQQLQLQQRPQGPAASQQQQHTELEAPGLLDELRALVARAGPACARDQQAVQQLAQEAAELRAALQASPEAAAAHQGEAALLKARLQETDGLLRNTGQGLVAAAKGLQECQEQLAAAQAEAAAQREQSAAAALLPLAPPLVIAPPAPPPPAEVQRLHEQLAWGEVEVLQLKAALQARDEQAAQAAADSERALVEARQQVHDRDAQVAALQAQVQELQGKLRGAQQQLQGTQRELASAQDKLLVAQAAREAAMSQATLHKQATAAAHEWAAATEADGRRVREASLQGSVGGACGDEMAGALAALHAELAQRAVRVDVPRARQLLARAQDTLERLLQRQ
jgi:DNA repair exonuclease SbcCD ATPase subunit